MNINFIDQIGNLLGVSEEMELYIGGELVTDLVIPGKYKTVKDYSFFGYKKLRSVIFEEGVVAIGGGAFSESVITKAILPNSIRRYGFLSSPFERCRSLKETNIPKGVWALPWDSLRDTAIESIELPEGLKVIPDGCFESCRRLKHVAIPNSVTRVGVAAFYDCVSLEELIFPDSVHFIGPMSLGSIKRIILPEDWNYIGDKRDSLFMGSELDKLKMNEYDNALYIGSRSNPYQVLIRAKSKDIENCHIHEDCLYICGFGSYSSEITGFYGCKNLKALALPKNLKRIEYEALSNCDCLESVELPPSFGSLDPRVYKGSPKLKLKGSGVKKAKKRILSKHPRRKSV